VRRSPPLRANRRWGRPCGRPHRSVPASQPAAGVGGSAGRDALRHGGGKVLARLFGVALG
jgi:hypothetical protein